MPFLLRLSLRVVRFRTGDVDQLVGGLPSTQEVMCLIPSATKLFVVAHTYNPSIQEVGAGGSEVQGYLQSYNELEASLNQ